MAENGSIEAVLASHRTVAIGNDDALALLRSDDDGTALSARALLDEHEFPAFVFIARAQKVRRLEREREFAVGALMQAVVIARAVAQQQRRRPLLAVVRALEQILLQCRRIALGKPERFVPAICRGREFAVQLLAKTRNTFRQRICEILVFAAPEIMPLHDDARTKKRIVVIERAQRHAFLRAQRVRKPGISVLKKLFFVHPIVMVSPPNRDRYPKLAIAASTPYRSAPRNSPARTARTQQSPTNGTVRR